MKRAAVCVVAAFAVAFVAVTVYAISSDKNEPVYPDVLIGGGEVQVSEGLSVAVPLSEPDTDAADAVDAAYGTGAADTLDEANVNDGADGVQASDDETSETAQRADTRFTVTFTFYQEESIVCSTPQTTVGALMDRLGITAGEGKRMYVSSDDVISADTEIRIDTVEYRTEYGTESVAYTTEYEDIRTIPRGTTKLCRSGQNGVKTVEYLCEYVNGELNSKETRGESITTAPVSQIMYRGVGGTIGGYSYSYYIDVQATTYTGGGTTASGLPANESVIAVDPSVISLGTKVYVTGSYGDFGVRTAADTGGSIVGNKIDIYLDSSNPYFANFGWRSMRVYILG
jgi:3D (Asp-Asp-Asp) domain-containing protein